MKQPFLSVCRTSLLVSSIGAVFSFSCSGTPTASASALAQDISEDTSKKAADPIVVSADTLAQAVQDDVNAAAKKYHLTELQVDGTVSKQSESKGQVFMFQFDLMVKDRETDKMVGFTIFCSLKDPLPKGDKRLDEFAVGKKVTVRGKSITMGNGQVTLRNCIIARKEDKSVGKGSTRR